MAKILDGPGIEKLRDLIAAAFSPDDLEFLLRVKMNLDLYGELVARGLADLTMVFRLIVELERRGSIVVFLRRAVEARPQRADLHDAVAQYCPDALQAEPDPKVAAGAAARGVEQLRAQL